MRTTLLLGLSTAWVVFGLLWVYPLKRRMLGIYGADKGNNFFINLAKQGDPLAKELYWRTKIFILVGLVGAVVLALSK